MDYMKKNLASYKIPDVIKEHDSLFRTQSGKIKEKPRYVSGEPTFLISAARAYKRSELLFTLFETGILSHLDGKTDIHTLAEKLNFDQNVLEKLMRLAESLRLVSQVKKNERFSLDPTPYIELESYLSRTFSVREEMADILKKGFHKRRFSTQTVSEEFVQKYNQAMHGPHISYKTIFGLHALRPKKGCRILEITTGPGRYLETFLERDKTAQGFLLQQGILSGEISSILKQAVTDKRLFIETKFENSMIDICIVNNSIHNFTSIESIQWVLKRLSSEGSILVDDIFLPVEGSDAEIGVDWFTHGGMAFQTFSELEQTIIRLGHTIRSLDAMGHPLQKLILIKKGK